MDKKQDLFGLSEDELIALLVTLIVVIVMAFYFIRSSRQPDGGARADGTPIAAEAVTPTADGDLPDGSATPVSGDIEQPQADAVLPPLPAGSAFATQAPTLTLPGERFLFGAVLIGGTAEADTHVAVQVDGRTVGSTPVGRDGQWSYTLGSGSLAPGERTIVAQGRGDGETFPSAAQTILMEAPEAPVFSGNYDGLTRAPGTYTIRGTATPNWRVLVQVDDRPPQMVSTDSAGNWSAEVTLNDPGSYTITAFAVDIDNNPIPTRKTEPARVTMLMPEATAAPETTPLVAVPVEETPEAAATPEAVATPEAAVTEAPPTDATNVATEPPTAEATPEVETTTEAEPPAPPAGPLAALQAAGNYTTLLAAIDVAGLTDALAAPEQPLTLFAPNDAAFNALPTGAIDAYLQQPDELRRLLQQHVVVGDLSAANLVELRAAGTSELATLAGGLLPLGERADGGLTVGGASVAQGDLRTPGGTAHGIDGVLLPPSDVAAPAIDASGVATFEGDFLTVVGSATPGTIVLLESNGETFGTTVVGEDGTWQIANDVTPGEYTLIAYSYAPGGLLRGASSPVLLTVR